MLLTVDVACFFIRKRQQHRKIFSVPWQVVGLVDAVVEEAAAFLSATSATLYILDKEDGILWARRRGLPGTPDAGALQVTCSVAPRKEIPTTVFVFVFVFVTLLVAQFCGYRPQ